jgi:hypothetical protein
MEQARAPMMPLYFPGGFSMGWIKKCSSGNSGFFFGGKRHGCFIVGTGQPENNQSDVVLRGRRKLARGLRALDREVLSWGKFLAYAARRCFWISDRISAAASGMFVPGP